ncbi:MAG: YtxH domain-containing protein [Chitinophagaceae bacterium]
MSNSKTVLGFLAGAAVGSILGILFAPDKGTETRKKLTETGTDVTDSLKSKFNDFVDGIRDTYQGVRDDAEDMADDGASRMNTFKNEAKSF